MLGAGLLAFATLGTLVTIITARDRIGGDDFFFYICTARDLVAGASAVTLERYAYFPGIYRFWGGVIAALGDDLARIQWVYLLLLIANGTLAGLVVGRETRRVAAGIVAAVLTLTFCIRLEALEGVAEPLATLPALVGVLAWSYFPERLAGATLLGIGMGLAVEARQHAVLLLAGLLPLFFERRLRRSGLLALVAATAAFLAAILIEGQGLWPIVRGVSTLLLYVPDDAPLVNLWQALTRSPQTSLALALVAAQLIARRRGSQLPLVAAMAAAAALAPLLQLSERAYAHYLILSAPFLAIALTIDGARQLSAPTPAVRRGVALAALALLAPGGGFSPLWPPSWDLRFPGRWRDDPAVARDLQRLKGELRRGEDVLILPPRRNDIHLALGTYCDAYSGGYNFGTEVERATPLSGASWERLEAIVVIHRRGDDEETAWQNHSCGPLAATLPARGFHEAARFQTLSVWRPQEPPARAAQVRH
jgi:hypothetical protein